MGQRNFLVDGVSGAGKTTVAEELEGRGFHVVHGDRVLAYQGDPFTGRPTEGFRHEHHVWCLHAVRALIADRTVPETFLCGGSRNSAKFRPLLDGVFVLEVDRETLGRRLAGRTDEFGGRAEERELVLRVHGTREDLPPDGISVDATRPLAVVVEEILTLAGCPTSRAGRDDAGPVRR